MTTSPMRATFDRAGFMRTLDVIKQVKADVMRATLTGPQASFVLKAQAYICTQIDLSLKANGSLKEGESRMVRGQIWKGWATHIRKTKRYGDIEEGTRFRMRKTARGSVDKKKTGATWGRDTRKAEMSKPAESRGWERVWKRRTGGTLYSEESQLMLNTRRMQAGIWLVDVRISGGTISLSPSSSQVSYFDEQNARRRMWVLEPGVDDIVIAGYANEELARVAKAIVEARA